eukprot:1137851-Pelagomonas_calceolata.AAC.4
MAECNCMFGLIDSAYSCCKCARIMSAQSAHASNSVFMASTMSACASTDLLMCGDTAQMCLTT